MCSLALLVSYIMHVIFTHLNDISCYTCVDKNHYVFLYTNKLQCVCMIQMQVFCIRNLYKEDTCNIEAVHLRVLRIDQ